MKVLSYVYYILFEYIYAYYSVNSYVRLSGLVPYDVKPSDPRMYKNPVLDKKPSENPAVEIVRLQYMYAYGSTILGFKPQSKNPAGFNMLVST